MSSRIVHSIAFSKEQWERIEQIAEQNQIPIGTLVRNAALHALGLDTEAHEWQRLATALETVVRRGG